MRSPGCLHRYGYKGEEIDKFFKNQAFLRHLKKSVKSEMRFSVRREAVPDSVFWDPTTGPRPSYVGAVMGRTRCFPADG